ncbi:sodium- and chloride-dependent betaine transporter-like [Clavelina lepadiformis]|uniref:sodium- and chloride-dependent betaine transporter-like n=1 Tax=Clavelina lepadiformis TaxID=159417 RepID=UPI0040411655
MERPLKMDNSCTSKKTKTKRETWSKPWDFVISSAGMCIGLGNIWRFPYLCFKYGGGAFLIPYILAVVVLAIPLTILEVSLGQSVQKGVIASWATIPIFKGISLASGVLMFHSNMSYPVILAWVFKYFVSSFTQNLPWMSCNNEWNTEHCIELFYGGNGTAIKTLNNFNEIMPNTTNRSCATVSMSAAEEFWNYGILGVSRGLHDIGGLQGDLALYLAVIWILGYLAIFQGIKLSAKVVYVTATLPVVLIIIVTIRGATLEGASLGIDYYLRPELSKLQNPEVWIGATSQVFYSYALCGAGLITLGSYNKYNQNFIRDSILIAFFNGFASFLCGFAVFSTLGSMAYFQNLTIQEVAQSGPGLVFIAYPQALALLPLPQFWNIIFFLTLLLLGFDSQFVYMESFCALFMDINPRLRKCHKYSRQLFLAICCVGFCLLGMIFMTKGGVYVFEMFNMYGKAGWCLFFIAACEFIAIGWVYGADCHWKEINRMIGPRKIQPIVTVVWKYVGPILCLAMSIYYVTAHSPLSYGSYVYPVWAQVVCHLISTSSGIWIPLYVLYLLVTTKKPWSKLRRMETSNKRENLSDSFKEEKLEMM